MPVTKCQMEEEMEMQQRAMTRSYGDWQEYYRFLPTLFFGLLMIWSAFLGVWTLNTWCKRRWQTSNLQWVMTAVPLLKSLVLGLSFTFWYTCLNLNTCSFWVAFGVFVTRIFFETICFVSFLLISHGYCIMHEQLSTDERRTIAGLASLLYLTLTGYKAAVPQFAALLVLIYMALFSVIFLHVGRSLNGLQEQLQQIQDDGIHLMHSAVHAKFTMFKKFQGAMLIMAVAQILMHARPDDIPSDYWLCLLLRELTEIGILFHVGWTFRSREVTRFFTVIPNLHTPGQHALPPIYSVEMNEKEFNSMNFKEWHIGVDRKDTLSFYTWFLQPTSLPKGGGSGSKSMLVIVQNPGISQRRVSEETSETAHDNICRSSAVQSYSALATSSKPKESQLKSVTSHDLQKDEAETRKVLNDACSVFKKENASSEGEIVVDVVAGAEYS